MAVDVFVKLAWVIGQIGDDEAGISLIAEQMLGFADDASQPAPSAGGIEEFPEAAMRLAIDEVLLPHEIEVELEVALQHGIAGQAEQIEDIVAFAPIHDAMPAEAAVAAKDDADIWPGLTQAAHEQLQDRPGMQRRIDLGGTQIGDQEMIAAHDVER